MNRPTPLDDSRTSASADAPAEDAATDDSTLIEATVVETISGESISGASISGESISSAANSSEVQLHATQAGDIAASNSASGDQLDRPSDSLEVMDESPEVTDERIPEAEPAADIVFLAPVANDSVGDEQPVYISSAVSPPVRIVDAKPAPPQPRPHFVVRLFMFVGGCAEWLFGVLSLMIGLAIVASIPILQFASLGYLLEASGRVARSGRIRDAFMGVKSAARIGGLVLGAWLVYSPLLLINEMWYSSYLIDPESGITGAWRVGQLIATVLIVVHVVISWFNGGRLRDYFWPIAAPVAVPWNLIKGRGLVVSIPPLRILTEVGQGNMLARRRDAVWDFLVGLQLPHLFWLGLRGFAGAVAWLVVPIMLLATAGMLPPAGAVLFSLAGAALLTVVLLYLPFLQTQFAMQGEMVAMFDLPKVRDKFRRAPIAFWFSLLITLLFAVPLYLLKIELTPKETLWIPSLVFVAFMFPARVLCGWVLGLASRREQPRHFVFRFFSRIAQVPIVLAYVGIVYLTQYLSWYGVWSLFEQHAFLTPAPFLGG